MNIKFFKFFFITTIITLILAGVYIIYVKDINKEEYREKFDVTTQISKEINMGITEFDTLNPILSKSLEIQQLAKLMYEPLINITEDFNVENDIAEECSKLDELTYIIKLNENKKWKDGTNVTVEDIEFTIKTINEADSIYKENVQEISKIEKISNSTFKIHLEKPVLFFEYLLSFPIVRQNTYNVDLPEGIGKYKITNLQKNRIEIEGEETKVIVKCFKNITELYNEFTRGNIDFIITQNTNYENYIGNVGFEENRIIGREYYYINFNIDNNNIRQIINNNINKEKLVYDLYKNKYIVTNFPLEYGSFLCKNGIIKNVEKSKIEQVLTLSTNIENREIAEKIKEQLEEEGIKLNILEYQTKNANLILETKTVPIIPDISMYFNEKTKEKILKVEQIENKKILKEEYGKIIDEYYEEIPFIGLYFDSYIILHSNKLKGKFSGNWYNMFYNINTWYKEI